MRLFVLPLEREEANAMVALWHRHHKPLLIHRFSLGVIDGEGTPHGATMVNKPAARLLSARDIVEVARLVTDGTPNACSILYAAAARAAKAMGYKRIQTYILDAETGASLRAAGWISEGVVRPSGGDGTNRPGRRSTADLGLKQRWYKPLAERPEPCLWPRAEHVGQEAFDLVGGVR